MHFLIVNKSLMENNPLAHPPRGVLGTPIASSEIKYLATKELMSLTSQPNNKDIVSPDRLLHYRYLYGLEVVGTLSQAIAYCFPYQFNKAI